MRASWLHSHITVKKHVGGNVWREEVRSTEACQVGLGRSLTHSRAAAGRSSRVGARARLKRRSCLPSVGCSLASLERTTRHCSCAWWLQVIGGGRALDVPWAKGSRVVSCGHRSSQPARHSDTSIPVVSLALYTYTHTLCLALFTLRSSHRSHPQHREYTAFTSTARSSIAIPYRFRYCCCPACRPRPCPASSPTCHSPDPRSMT
jgi:hypothetical protein